MKDINYPLTFRFPALTLGPSFRITDAHDRLVVFVKRKVIRGQEDISVYADERKRHLLYGIKATKMLDYGGDCYFTDAEGKPLGHAAYHPAGFSTNSDYEVYAQNNEQILYCKGYNFWRYLGRLSRKADQPSVDLKTSRWATSELIGRPGEPPMASLNQKGFIGHNHLELVRIRQLKDKEEELMLKTAILAALLRRQRRNQSGE